MCRGIATIAKETIKVKGERVNSHSIEQSAYQ